MHATDIVGYTYRANIYCVECTTEIVQERLADDYGHNPLDLSDDTAMDLLARRLGIANPDDWFSYDSYVFPKGIFSDMAHDVCGADSEYDYPMCVDICGRCNEPIGESCPALS